MFNAENTKNAIIQWVKQYFQNNAAPETKAVIGISGGKDSAVAAALCVEALGKIRVLGVLMPQGRQYDIDVAYRLCQTLDIPHIEINIENAADALYTEINKSIPMSAAAKINTPARIRMTVLYAVAATVNGRVVNTCNLSEDWVGYATKYGDAAGDFSPLSQLTVTEVKAVGRALQLPSEFIDKTPEDGLTGKSDEENLGFTYAVLDQYIREGICDDPNVKAKIDKRHAASQHKRSPMPTLKHEQ